MFPVSVYVLAQDKTLSVILDSFPLHTCLFNLQSISDWPASPCPHRYCTGPSRLPLAPGLLWWPTNRIICLHVSTYCLLSVSQITSLPRSYPSKPSPYIEGLCEPCPQNLTDGASPPTSVPYCPRAPHTLPSRLLPKWTRCVPTRALYTLVSYCWETCPCTSVVCSTDSFKFCSNIIQKPSQLPMENGNIISYTLMLSNFSIVV